MQWINYRQDFECSNCGFISTYQYPSCPNCQHTKKEITMAESLERSSMKDQINPDHYKNVAAGKQYMELMVDMLANKTGVEAHLYGQIYKYLMRAGKKDDENQELEKALWYLQALLKYRKDGVVM